MCEQKEHTGSCWPLLDYEGGRAKGGSDSAEKRRSNAVIGHIHPGPTTPSCVVFFFSLLSRICRGHAHTLTPAGFTVCRTRFILSSLLFNCARLNSPSPFIAQHPILLHLKHPFDEDPSLSHDWDTSACTLGSSHLVRTFSRTCLLPVSPGVSFSFFQYGASHFSFTLPPNIKAPFYASSHHVCPIDVFSNIPYAC